MSTSDLQETQWKMFNMQELSDFHSHIRLFSEAHKVKIISYRDKKNSVCDWYGSRIILKMKKKNQKKNCFLCQMKKNLGTMLALKSSNFIKPF